MARTALPAQSTVSEWLKATVEIHQSDKYAQTKEGKAAWKLWDQFRLISANDVERETEKAIGVKCTYWNSCANAKPGTAWIPKSQIKEIANDYWTNPDQASRFYLVPTWLINAKKAEGYEI